MALQKTIRDNGKRTSDTPLLAIKEIIMNTSKYIFLVVSIMLLLSSCKEPKKDFAGEVAVVLKDSVLLLAKRNLQAAPITVTAAYSPRSVGGIHDFYSEGDYWWPDTLNPEGPYIRRDGLTNPNNFTAHREALMRFSEIVGNLCSAYLLTEDLHYAKAALAHCKAWFIEDSTKMSPHLLYSQAIKGRHTGRGIGIIDGIHFMEVVQSLNVLAQKGLIKDDDLAAYKIWFADFTHWLTTHPYGLDEKVHPNNHGTCWNMQVGAYAVFTGNDSILQMCREHFTQTLLPNQMAEDGSFPLELARTKPYGYALFNLDAMVMNAVVLSDYQYSLWDYTTPDGKSILKGLDYMLPYVMDKASWPLAPDVMYWENWPVAHPAFLFGAKQFDRIDFFNVWKKYQHFPKVFEVKRNLPIRNPLIWIAQ